MNEKSRKLIGVDKKEWGGKWRQKESWKGKAL